jgi:SnoaL-like domain
VSPKTAFQSAVESKDVEAIAASLAQDVVFHSPVLFKPFEGREVVVAVLQAVADLMEDFSYTREFVGNGEAALFFKAHVGSRQLEGVDLLDLDEDGLVTGLTVFMRPLSAITAFSEAMGAKLEAAGVR